MFEQTENSGLWVPSARLQEYVMSVDDLMEKEVSPIKWVIPGILPEGFTVLASKPKVGKSTLSLDTAIAVARQESLLGLNDHEPLHGRTLYIALDDTQINRAQERMQRRIGTEGRPALMNYSVKWPRDYDKALDYLEEFITTSPEPVEVIIIDVLQKFIPEYKEDAGAYQKLQTYLPPLRELAQKYHVALVGLMHTTKNEDRGGDWTSAIYGNTAVLAEADNILG